MPIALVPRIAAEQCAAASPRPRWRLVRFTLAATLIASSFAPLIGCAAGPLTAGPFTEQAAQIRAPDVTLTGRLFVPKLPGAATPTNLKTVPATAAPSPSPERRPAIVLLHGCGGMFDSRGQLAPRDRAWAERFARWGYTTLVLDSFGPRGVSTVCDLAGKDHPARPWEERTGDAYTALDWLAARPDVDPKRVFLIGWSHGGSTVIGVIRSDAPGRTASGPRFKAAIAFYPVCDQPLRAKGYRATMPLQILQGEADDWTPVTPCIDLVKRLQAAHAPAQIVTYLGAYHAFDAPGNGNVRYLPNVYNPVAPGSRGAHVGPNPQAREASIEDVRRFVGKLAVNPS